MCPALLCYLEPVEHIKSNTEKTSTVALVLHCASAFCLMFTFYTTERMNRMQQTAHKVKQKINF